jgi:PAS domain S-box-containing protein
MTDTPAPVPSPGRSGAAVLLVDDQPANLLALRALLEDLGAELVEARSGAEALDRVRERPFAVVLLDVRLGDLDGFETARLIRARPDARSTPVIFLTAYEADRAQLERGYGLGAVDFLTKPLVPAAVRAKVAALVQLFEEKARAKRQAEQYRLLVEGTKDHAIFMLDPGGRIATWNTGAERLKGYPADEIIGQHFSRFYPPEAVARGWPEEELRRAAVDGRIEDEGWRVRKDGSRFWANVVITALRDETGALRGFGKVTRDMTTRREAEETARRLIREEAARQAAEASAVEAQRQREEWRITLASIGDAVIATDADGRITFLNPVAEGLTGFSAEEAAGQPLERVFPVVNEHTHRAVENPVARALRERAVVALANQTALLARSGHPVPIEDSAAPIRGADGAVVGAVMVFRDVTEQRRATEARRLLAAIVESSDDAIIGEGLDGTILSWNAAAGRLYGYTAPEVVGRPLALLVPPERIDELAAITARLARGEKVEHFETVRVHKNGTRLDVSLTISPIRGAEGVIVGASKIARDITAIKRREAELRFLAGASAALAELLDVPGTLQAVARLAVPHFADWCAVDLLTADGDLERVALAHADPEREERAQILHHRHPPDPGAPGAAWRVLRSARAELVPELTDEMLVAGARDPDHLRAVRELGLRSYMGVPLTARGRTTGVITFVAAEAGRRFGPEDLRLAEDLARRAAVAVENARLYAELREADWQKSALIATLRESEQFHRAIAELSSDYAFRGAIAPDGTVIIESATEGFERFYGFTRARMNERGGWGTAIHPDDHAAVFRTIERLRAGEPNTGAVRGVTADGTVKWQSYLVVPVRDERTGGVVGLFGAAKDVTAQRELTDRLREQAESLSAILSATVDHIYLIDRAGRYRYVSEGGARVLGVRAEEMTGKTWRELGLPAEVMEPFDAQRQQVLESDRPHRFETPFHGTDGERHYEYTVAPVRGESAQGSVVVVSRDDTERKRAEEALREAARRKDEFLALLGHELRNPLAPIKNALRILELKGNDPAVVNRAREMIDRQATQLTRLVEELLDASRIARGKVRLTVEALDLSVLVRTAVEDHRTEAEAAGLSVELVVPPGPVRVRGDAARLTQVVTNLWANAVKFTPKGGRVSVRLGTDGREAVLSVADTGVGLDPATIPSLFQPFRQVDADPARTKGGLGLGLSVVRGLIELHGGRVEGTSAGPGRGATFTVRLALGTAEPVTGSGRPAPGTIPAGGGRRVVLIEDSGDAAESMRELLELKGFAVAVARTGPEGVELCHQVCPDGVVSDLGLPGLSGFDVARALRADPRTAGAVLVAVSGYAQEEDRRRARDAGFDALLPKPADPDDLARLLAARTQ